MKKTGLWLAMIIAPLVGGCFNVHVDPVHVDPIQIEATIHIKIERELDDFFSTVSQKTHPATSTSAPSN